MKQAILFTILASPAFATEWPINANCGGFTASYPDGVLLQLDIRNRDPDFTTSCIFETEDGPVTIFRDVSQNGANGCCADRYTVTDQPEGTIAQPFEIEIEARAKRRLADEYDAAQARGEVATRQHNPGSVGHVGADDMPPAIAADLGLRRDEIHEARQIRDAEAADPGVVRRALDDRLERGEGRIIVRRYYGG